MTRLPTDLPADTFELLCRDTPDVLVLVDSEGRIRFVNQRIETLLGYTPDQVLGRSVEMLVPARFARHADLRRVYQRSPEVRPMGGSTILKALHRCGSEVPVDIALAEVGTASGAGHLALAVLRDASRRHENERRLHLQNVALEAAANGIVIADRQGIVRWANPAFERMTGYSLGELIGQHTRVLKSGHHDASFYRALWETVLAGRTWFGEITNRRKDGTMYREEQHIAPVTDDTGEVTHFIAIKQDVTARRQAEEALQAANEELRRRVEEIEILHQQMRDLVVRDSLTGLHNRRYLDETMPRELARAQRSGTPLSVVLMDVDHFKSVNDTSGHAAGDTVLRQLGEVLAAMARRGDVCCRLGGDEFLVVLPGARVEIARDCAERWGKAFADAQARAGRPCTLSMGVAQWRGDDADADALLRRADEALYDAKRRGRNVVCVCA